MELLELDALERILELGNGHLRVSTLHTAQLGPDVGFPVYGIALGSTAADVPVAGFFGGVHGLERIGSESGTVCCTTSSNMCAWSSCPLSIQRAWPRVPARMRKGWI